MGGYSIIVFSDILLPGLLIAFSLRYDWLANKTLRAGYFLWAMIAYGLGLLITYVALNLMDGHGQAALLFIVPFTLEIFSGAMKKKKRIQLHVDEGNGKIGMIITLIISQTDHQVAASCLIDTHLLTLLTKERQMGKCHVPMGKGGCGAMAACEHECELSTMIGFPAFSYKVEKTRVHHSAKQDLSSSSLSIV
ncbi:hypothetical protein J1N35_009982 [Gossypium stocksii]|uniref:Uncharacterized protein n=1 Tax=Gossypium stocksii TaxID=47602 RepID=A0A9D4ABE6_9ROSI|nr:hypothetical protein J1N35_009982 [Gossypium stocksii]